ncbi:MAG: 23S rRNA (pseudouridine(1915)-N(3))-methyltransferase RlmH [Campylobacteraceae bacterium]|nr:23S rRNA (pseudouridine(1915)-N(3))-methyltransferase RlmH [Campylobacteraceae bacterium]
MNITVYAIEKVKDRAFENVIKEYLKMTKRFANIQEKSIFNKQIALSQTKGEVEAKKSYTKAYEPFLNGYTVSLDVQGEEVDSFEFSKVFQENANVNFFIGGAFGFEKEFLAKTQKIISLSKLTYAHKIAKAVLFEQIYRGLCIKSNHPYHK